jgi:signal recognition particle subunit SRP68
MYMKSMHAADSSEKAITGSTKKHIVSRLRRAETEAALLVSLLEDLHSEETATKALLEARAYQSMLLGSLNFEAQRWERSLTSYAEAYYAYRALSKASSGSRVDSFGELLSSNVEPSIRYAAYQLRLPRTLSIQSIAARYVNKNSAIVRHALVLDPSALEATPSSSKQDQDVDSKDVPRTITWRKRVVNLEDATVAQALALANSGQQQLLEALADPNLERQDQAAAYDRVLNPSQDAVDATVTAISELTADGVASGDARMQALQITRTAVNYALVGWRVGRNRVLCGRDDGAHIESEVKRRKKSQDGSKKVIETVEEQSTNKKLAGLRERVALLNSTLQSLDSIRELPGVAADAELLKELASRRAYFAALRCLNIAHGHAILSSYREALALYARALDMAKTVAPDANPSTQVPNLEISQQQASFLTGHLQSLTHQYRALAQLTKDAAGSAQTGTTQPGPWIEHLHEYPASGSSVDLTRLVDYPARLRAVPVKPIFLDLAWDYVDFPGQDRPTKTTLVGKAVDTVKETIGPNEGAQKPEGKRGWWFGRS